MKKLTVLLCILFFSLSWNFGQENSETLKETNIPSSPLGSWTSSQNQNGKYFIYIDKNTVTYIDRKDEEKRVAWTYSIDEENIIFGNCVFCSVDEKTASIKALTKIFNALKENQNMIRYSVNGNSFELYFSEKPDTYKITETKTSWTQTRYFYRPSAAQILEIVINKNYNPIASKKDVEKLADEICKIAW